MIVGWNDAHFTEGFSKVDAPDIACVEFEFGFAPEIFIIDAAGDEPKNGRVFGNGDRRAIGRFNEFRYDRREGYLSGGGSFDARMLGVDLAESGLIRF